MLAVPSDPVLPPAPRLTPEQAMDVRRALLAVGYDVDGVRQRLGDEASAALARSEQVPALRATRSGDPLDALVRLFLLGRDVDAPALPPALTAVDGLLIRAGEGRMRATVDIRPWADGWYVVSDHRPRGEPVPADHVVGVGSASLTLLGATVPIGVLPHRTDDATAEALDLGTGCGVLALHLAGQGARVTATDTNPRALALAAASLALSGLSADLREGDLWEPVSGRRFDLIVANPPFVVGPGRVTYRDSGLPGDEVSHRVVAGAGAHLADDGVAEVLASWLHRDGERWEDRVRGWLPAGCDALVLQREVLDPAAHVSLWLDDEGLEGGAGDYEQRYADWLDDLAAQGATGVGFGLVVLRRPGRRPADPTVRLLDARGWAAAPTSNAVRGWLDRVAALRGYDTAGTEDRLAAAQLRRAPGLELRSRQEPGGDEGWEPVGASLHVPDGTPPDVTVDPTLVRVTAAVDSGLPLGVLGELVATASGEPDAAARLLPAVRSLVEAGHLLLA